MAIGTLKFQLFIGNRSLPVRDAEIIIIDNETATPLIEGPLSLDENGTSSEIKLYTYEKALSQDPNETMPPYRTYDAIIASNSFKNIIIKNIPIFDGLTSLQQIPMIPKTRTITDSEDIVIPPNGLLYSVKPIKNSILPKPNKITPKILSETVIPKNITVHLGSPTSNAQNVTVLFTDYIKNVASSEIYPTWPVDAIRSNIIAQISFTLNRIFTEWYRSRGYNFDITNSTAYDHFFVVGRNIFDNISEIVDDIFDDYIAKADFLEPLLAQYCNGTTVTCDGLSQWGTVTAANSGLTTFEILQKYYGYDIESRSAKIIEGVPESYPGIPLKLGSSSDDVKIIQDQLNRVGKNYPAIPNINPVDGNFNKITEDAIKVFQRVFNLTPDGIVGKSTWYKISQIYVGVKKLGELQSEGETLPIPPSPPSYILKLGSTGDGVKLAQFFLACIAVFYDAIPPIKITGVFDKETENAVKAFQTFFGLTSDGIVGKITWNKLYEVYKTVEPFILTASGQIPKWPGYIIREGSRGDNVKTIQNWLKTISKKYTKIPSVNVDGIFGPKTKSAVIAFQNLFGLTPDGLVGILTWNKLFEIYAEVIKEGLA
ncbi:MAG: peptidoglycan-binding protein [Clostridium sp.]|uniref:peptidoglycan-binding domain-containing protein n=1 Tax=Clostridium sp. TaxID=1506 RepID=UPI00304CA46C